METSGERVRLYISGMTCINCQHKIEETLKQKKGIVSARANYSKGTLDLVYDKKKQSLGEIIAVIEKLGYEVSLEEKQQGFDITNTISMLIIIIFLYGILQSTGILNRLAPSQLADTKMGYGMLFVIGLITSIHCVAMCGGINLSQCISTSTFRPALLYNLGRVFSYTAIGFVLGLVGFFIGGGTGDGISTVLQGVLKITAGVFMVVMGINMLGIFPWLRKFTIRMPKFLARKVGKEKARNSRPFIVGVLNGFMPCGPLQAMWIVALATENPFAGAISMFLFSLGTVPLMLGLGSAVAALGKKFTDKVMRIGAVMVVVLGLAMMSQGSALSGISFYRLWNTQETVSEEVEKTDGELVDGVQVVNSTLGPGGYPDITVQAGILVKWVIDAPEGSINGCNYMMVIRDYGIEYAFQTGENIIEFTPTEAGTVPYSCWMGMIRGDILVE